MPAKDCMQVSYKYWLKLFLRPAFPKTNFQGNKLDVLISIAHQKNTSHISSDLKECNLSE